MGAGAVMMPWNELLSLASFVLAIAAVGVSWGVMRTWITAMQKDLSETKSRHEREMADVRLTLRDHDERVRAVEVAIEGIETNIEAMLRQSAENGSKLDRLLGMKGVVN